MKSLITYLPVWHAGYEQMINTVIEDVDTILIVDPSWAQTLSPDLDYLRKEIRALSAHSSQHFLAKLYPSVTIAVLNESLVKSHLMKKIKSLVAPDEDVSKIVAEKFFPNLPIEYCPIFLRWDRTKATEEKPIASEATVLLDELTKQMFAEAYLVSEQSSDWWRHVGAVLTSGKKILFAAANRHQPSDFSPYISGDVRQLFHQKEYMNYSTAEHAECAVIAQAARIGVSTNGASLYVTTFPCPYCARLIVHAGIAKLYFTEGYATLDGEEVLKLAGVEIIRVEIPKIEQQSRSIVKQYLA